LLVNIKKRHTAFPVYPSMAFIKRFHPYCQWLAKDNLANPGRLFLLLACLFATPVVAHKLTVQVRENTGGKIAIPGQGECLAECEVPLPPAEVLSLFAVPASGYRFAGWQGVCGNTTGPLCTLSVGQGPMASVRFEATEATPKPVKALLLVHGPGGNAFVWNDFVGRYFDNRCPVIYGGVILDDDASNPANQVHCYRVELGYYARFFQGTGYQDLQQSALDWGNNENFPREFLTYEIKAAYLGILNRHPHSSLVVVASQGFRGLAARFLSPDDDGFPGHVVGWLALADTAPQRQGKGRGGDGARLKGIRHGAFLSLYARPDQTRKLNKALGQLAPDWW